MADKLVSCLCIIQTITTFPAISKLNVSLAVCPFLRHIDTSTMSRTDLFLEKYHKHPCYVTIGLMKCPMFNPMVIHYFHKEAGWLIPATTIARWKTSYIAIITKLIKDLIRYFVYSPFEISTPRNKTRLLNNRFCWLITLFHFA